MHLEVNHHTENSRFTHLSFVYQETTCRILHLGGSPEYTVKAYKLVNYLSVGYTQNKQLNRNKGGKRIFTIVKCNTITHLQ